jgi:hypothetical protein
MYSNRPHQSIPDLRIEADAMGTREAALPRRAAAFRAWLSKSAEDVYMRPPQPQAAPATRPAGLLARQAVSLLELRLAFEMAFER